MRPYFETKERQELLRAELDAWLDTPWRHRCMVKGRGCDCIGLVAGALMNVGFLQPGDVDFPSYPPDWNLHKEHLDLLNWFKSRPDVAEVKQPLQNGDILLFQYGKSPSHTGLFFEKTVYHSVTGRRVVRSPFGDPNLLGRMAAAFRCMEVPK
ncbi:MAG: hypothetical protein B1H12_04670 [Desulfobacteraceae bacterium 4484_190.2]|nr:MAG: hypothetical protein B1H12_04670 [Desulfobacteraceae bacterium 4484_190.2]